MGINYGSLQIGDVRAGTVSAAPCVGASLLRFSLVWTIYPRRDHAHGVFGTYLLVSVGYEGAASSAFLGQAVPEVAWADQSHPGGSVERPLLYILTLHSNQLLALEQLRGNRGLRFKIEVRGNSVGPNGIFQIDSSIEISVTLSDWVRILLEANAKDVLLVGVEIPRASESQEMETVFQYVRRAHAFLLQGESNASVGECRRALESMWKSRALEQSAANARKALSSNMDARKGMAKRDRQLALGEALRNYMHPAHHVQSGGTADDFSRADASLAVAATTALISSLMLG